MEVVQEGNLTATELVQDLEGALEMYWSLEMARGLEGTL